MLFKIDVHLLKKFNCFVSAYSTIRRKERKKMPSSNRSRRPSVVFSLARSILMRPFIHALRRKVRMEIGSQLCNLHPVELLDSQDLPLIQIHKDFAGRNSRVYATWSRVLPRQSRSSWITLTHRASGSNERKESKRRER